MASPFYVALTVDVDPDANRPERGRADAVSAGTRPASARYDACVQGMRDLLDILTSARVPCTMFWEGRALQEFGRNAASLLERVMGQASFEHGCHGLRHEDFAGAQSGVPLDASATDAAIAGARAVFCSVFGRFPSAFRAPYCRLSPELVQVLSRYGFDYDASLTKRPSQHWALRPFRLISVEGENPIWELALCRCSDRRGKAIGGYLWQLFEGKRCPEDYVETARALSERYAGGLLQIALHPWHLCVCEHGDRFPEELRARARRALGAVLDGVGNLPGVQFTTTRDYLERWLEVGRKEE